MCVGAGAKDAIVGADLEANVRFPALFMMYLSLSNIVK